MDIFIICAVRIATEQDRIKLEAHTTALEGLGHKVHLPHRDTNQEGTGLSICSVNARAIANSDEVHIFYNAKSQGSHFDMGVAFALGKKIVIITNEPLTLGKSFQNMLVEWGIEYDRRSAKLN